MITLARWPLERFYRWRRRKQKHHLKIIERFGILPSRERKRPIERAVVHAMGEFVLTDQGVHVPAIELLRQKGLSAHALVEPDGTIIKTVRLEEVAYHVGAKNETSLGIEVLVRGNHDYGSFLRAIADEADPPFTREQYDAAGWWLAQTGVDWAAIVRHSDLDPAKRDPGQAFDWQKLKARYEHHRERRTHAA